MTNRTKTAVSFCAAIMASGFAYSQLAYTQFAKSMILKAGIVGLVAASVSIALLTLLPPRKS